MNFCSYFPTAKFNDVRLLRKFAHKLGDNMQYVLKIGANYYYNRHRPEIVMEYDFRKLIRVSYIAILEEFK